MYTETPIHLGKWKVLLAVAASSILTGLLARIGLPPVYGVSVLLGLLLIYWTLLGITVGTWIVYGRGWRVLERDDRLRLAFGYFAIAWGALITLSVDTPVSAVFFVAPGLAGLLLFAVYLLEGRQHKPDESDIFP